MWRMARGRTCPDALSPFFYLALIEHFGPHCMIIEKGGETVGYVLVTAPRGGGVVRIVDLCLRAPHDTNGYVFEVLSSVIALPAYRNTELVQPAASCHSSVRKALRELLGLGAARCTARESGRAAAAG
jgi:hypothetical protein